MKAFYNRVILTILLVAVQNVAIAFEVETLFNFNTTDGRSPYAALIRDAKDNLYGTTALGGANGKGTVFRLTPPSNGQTAWTQTTLLDFDDTNGANPYASLIRDAKGNLYGTTALGGANGKGTVFRLTPPTKGQTAWTQTTLLDFDATNGSTPLASLILDAKGNIFGTSQLGGANSLGNVFRLTPPTRRQTAWTQTTLLEFNDTDGVHPVAGLIKDAKGNLYGTTTAGSALGGGTVFRLTSPAKGQTAWTHTTLLEFIDSTGNYPGGDLTRDSKGNLYGTTKYGGGTNNVGTLFRLTPPAKDQTEWTQTRLLEFNITNGANPAAGLIRDAKGNLYGTTIAGGANGAGTVFRLKP
jgi:uncharacterized repeat protein (TIGR03803 family)